MDLGSRFECITRKQTKCKATKLSTSSCMSGKSTRTKWQKANKATSNRGFARLSRPSECHLHFFEKVSCSKAARKCSHKVFDRCRTKRRPKTWTRSFEHVPGDFELLFCTCKQQTTFLRGNARAKEIVHGIIEYPAWLQELGQSRVIEEAFRHIVPSSQLPGCLRIRNIPIPRGTYNRCERMARFKMERDTNHPRRKYTDRIIADSQRHNKISISSQGSQLLPVSLCYL